MTAKMTVKIEGWENGSPIPGKFAFGIPAEEGHVQLSTNINPKITWEGTPAGTKSFAIICHDPDVPSVGDDVNQEGKTVPADLPRVDFYHWVLVDIDASRNQIDEGEDSKEITAGGKSPGTKSYGLSGLNNYTDWFAGDATWAENMQAMTALAPHGMTVLFTTTILQSTLWI
nr:YbhB/YbcL family Raf kinase inhibitor-like protein [Sneathiella glossodoripedis]